MTEAKPAQTADYLQLFLNDTPLIDTRAPVEFARGAFPHAVNLPLMTNEERAQVGTCYKQQGQEAAIALGHELVTGDIKAQRVQAWLDFAQRNPEGYLYCFRGGLRSQICQQWLADAGCQYPRVCGGYKAMRRFLIDSLENIANEGRFILLAGRTGAAKTDLLTELPAGVDLEGLAHHRGSAFGRRPGGQPSQIDFENALAIQLLRRKYQTKQDVLVLEDEGHFIGSCTIPEALRNAMTTAPLVVVEAGLDARVEHSFKNYILDNLTEWQHRLGVENGFMRFADDLRYSFKRVSRRLGGVRFTEFEKILEEALAVHAQGDESLHRLWIRPLLEAYYDPMYDYQLRQKADRVVFRGCAEDVKHFLTHSFSLSKQRKPL